MVGRRDSSLSIRGPMAKPRNDSILYVSVLSARELKKTQVLGEQDPYTGLYLCTAGNELPDPSFKTSTIDNGGTHPRWNEKGTILVPDVTAGVLKMKVMNENWVGSNVIGEAAIALKDLSRGRSMKKEFALTPQGFLSLQLYLSIGHENPSAMGENRIAEGEYPQHFIAGRSKLYVGLIGGDKLRDVQSFGTQDPFCKVFLSKGPKPSSEDLVYRGKTHDNGGKHPNWTEGVAIPVRCIEHDYLTVRVKNDNTFQNKLIGEMCVKVEALVGLGFEDKQFPVEAEGTIVGQIRLQLALFNDEVLEEEEAHDESADLEGCTCATVPRHRGTHVGNVLLDGISPDGIHYLEPGSVVTTGSELAGEYVLQKDCVDNDDGISWSGASGSEDEWEGDEF